MSKTNNRKKVIYQFICDEMYTPMKIKDIAIMFQVPKENRRELQLVLNELVDEGKIRVSAKGKFLKCDKKAIEDRALGKVSNNKREAKIDNNKNKKIKANNFDRSKYKEEDILEGIFTAHERGFGFVTIEGREEDIFIPSDMVKGAFQGDTVEIILLTKSAREGKRQEGKVINIKERGVVTIVGFYEKSKKFGFVKPDNQKFTRDIFIPLERSKGAVTGHKVVVELLGYGTDKKKPEGKVIEIIGHINDPGTDILSIIKGNDLPTDFPEKVLDQAERVGKAVTKKDMEGRKDIREWQTVTIDGEDAKDLDDAITLVKDGHYYHLGVHIADVTNYVQEKSALDTEALKRGTSVYLVDRVIPMLPHILSNGVCSLNAGEDRLALSCIMKINRDGQVVDHEIAETVIHVDRRMTYTSVKNILELHDEGEIQAYKELVPMFKDMEELAQILRDKRFGRGAIDFDFPETKMILDEQGVPVEIKAYDRNVATKLIEEFMLLANETVSEHYTKMEVPFVYRTHEVPDSERIQTLKTFIQKFGHTLYLSEDKVKPLELQKLLDKIDGTAEKDLISRLVLRSMKQAKYSPDNDGHFGLAAEYYSHFTSPIRRYPDLQIHRIIKEDLRKKLNPKRQQHYKEILAEVTKQCSELERRAETSERDTIKLKKAEYMERYIGESFKGIVGSLTKWGMYIELENTIEGLVHVTSMTDDHYEYYEEQMEMIGERAGKCYKLGQEVMVDVVGVDRLARTIDFKLTK